jgi:progranulin
MRDFTSLLALPACLLTLLTPLVVHAEDLLPRTAEYPPEHQALVRREWEAAEKLTWQAPIGVKKMSGDEDEKFFLHYWDFGNHAAETQLDIGQSHSFPHGNASVLSCPLPGIVPHSEHYGRNISLFGRSLFSRDFKCPGNTYSCSSAIDADICCHPNQTCVSTDEGPGCCPNGESCGDSVGDCTDGYSNCNGGCCVPGAVCKASGCILYGTQTTVTTLHTVTRTSGDSSTTLTGSGRTVTVIQPTVRVSTKTVTSGHTTTKTVTLGSTKDTKASPNPPVLKTSVSASSQSSNSKCLPGYYMCSAHLLGGCCKVGRDCDTTHCPPTGSTIYIGGGVTVVQSGPTGVHKTCNNGLFSCPASVKGGCCPNGYQCGVESCAGRNGNADTAKVAPSDANVVRWAGTFLALAVTAGLGMILL